MKTIAADISWVNYNESDLKQISRKVKQILANYKSKILKINAKDLSFKNLIHVGEETSFEIGRLCGILFPFSNLHTDIKLRNASMKVELDVSKILTEFAYNEDVYKQFVKYYVVNFQKEKSRLSNEEVKVVEDQKKSYDKMGMGLPKASKKRLLTLKNKIEKLAQEFDKNTTKNYEIGLYFKEDELVGVPIEYLKSFKYNEKTKKYFVNCSGRDDLGTDYPIIKKYCANKITREKATFLNEEGVGEKNNKKLREILKLRHEIKNILHFDTWSNLSVDDEMMNDPKEVRIFLLDLIKSLSSDYMNFRDRIAAILKDNNEKLSTASFAYGRRLLNDKEVEIKEEEYKRYFELNNVLSVIFRTWEDLFDVKAEYIQGITFFHEDTKFYKYTDSKTGELLGHGIIDLHPRPGKYGHACVADIFKKYRDLEGNRHAGLTYMVCNFKKAPEGKTFITLSDMNTLYHEAGHMLHMILMKNNYLSTGQTSRDFVEIPSQFHEGFLSNENFILKNFKHFDTNKPMSNIMVKNIKKIISKGEAGSWIRTSLASLFDQEIHGKNILTYVNDKNKLDKEFNRTWVKYLGVPLTNKNMHFPSRWGHLVHGYDAKYYSYVISKVYAVDFWNEFSKTGIKRGKTSGKYKKILEAANTVEEKVLVKKYLEREVSQKPFLESIK